MKEKTMTRNSKKENGKMKKFLGNRGPAKL
jgi:hypothetical protein